MAKQTTLNRSVKVENGSAVIEETTQKTLNRAELENERMGYLNQIANLDRQIQDFKLRRASLVSAIGELDGIIAQLPLEETDESEG
jgi:hypothetical protein